MDREKKIKVLQAIASGDVSSIARPLPGTYLIQFKDQRALEQDVKVKYGTAARVFIHSRKVWVVTEQCGFWIFTQTMDGIYHDGQLSYNATQFDKLTSELRAGEAIEWIEIKPIIATQTEMQYE